MIVASLDPVGHTVSMVSVPRDLVNVPLGNGDVLGPKLNSLMSYAERHPDEFPKGGVRALQDAVGALLDIDIQYYAAGRLRRVRRDGRCRRWRRRRRQEADGPAAVRRLRPGRPGAGAQARSPAPVRSRGARLRPDPQGTGRERLHAGGAPATDPPRPARRGHERPAASCSSCRRCSRRSATA